MLVIIDRLNNYFSKFLDIQLNLFLVIGMFYITKYYWINNNVYYIIDAFMKDLQR